MFITVAGEDDKFCGQLERLLLCESHKVSVIKPLAEVGRVLQGSAPHLLVLVPDAAGRSVVDLLGAVRNDSGLRRLPILCINPRGGGADGVAYLDAGADDFVNRPFNPHIFLARVRTLLRRRVWSGDLEQDEATILRCGALAMNLLARQVLLSGRPVVLTRLEFDLLAFLVRGADQVFSRSDILEAVWNYPQDVATRTLDKHVETLRRKLGAVGAAIETIHGVGYRLAPSALEMKRA
ncbi:MAG: response regulator transcription factor [Elusimicrobia bacterium]|nr:response regulator transcription factor [Elusimicrobiota bacterium]